jgi:hypothetical protein
MPDVHVRGSPVSSRVAEQINQSAPAVFLGKSITDMLSLVLCKRPQIECVVATPLGTMPQPKLAVSRASQRIMTPSYRSSLKEGRSASEDPQ